MKPVEAPPAGHKKAALPTLLHFRDPLCPSTASQSPTRQILPSENMNTNMTPDITQVSLLTSIRPDWSIESESAFGRCEVTSLNTQRPCCLLFPPSCSRCWFCPGSKVSVFLAVSQTSLFFSSLTSDGASQVSLWERPAVFESVTVLTPTGLGLFTSTAQIDEAAVYVMQPTVQVVFKCFSLEADQHRGQTHFLSISVFP